MVESYRRIRNTLRFLLANTVGLRPRDRTPLPVAEMAGNRPLRAGADAQLQDEVAADYARYEFHLVVQKLQSFCSEDLGAFYLDILKDRLYTCGADARAARRSAQTALWHITASLVRLMAPILSFTAEEAWQLFRGDAEASVFFETLQPLPGVPDSEALLARWTRLRALRAPVRKRIEALRAAGKVGSSLQAEVDYRVDDADYALLSSLGDELRFVLITSAARAQPGGSAGDDDAAVEVTPSTHAKCERCWHYRRMSARTRRIRRCAGAACPTCTATGEVRRHA